MWQIPTGIGGIGPPPVAPPTTLSNITLSGTTFIASVFGTRPETPDSSVDSGPWSGGIVVGTITVSTSSGIFTGTLTLSGANASSFQIVGANLETNGYVAPATYNLNIVANQPGAIGSPLTVPFVLTGTAIAPSPAAAVGYNTQTFGPAMTFATDPTKPLNGANWAPFTFFGVAWQSIVVAQNPDGSLGLATGNMGDNYGGQICSAVFDSTQGASGKYMRGHAFGGGAFFEATLSFTGAPSATGVSFWSNDIEHMAGGSQGDSTLYQWPGQVAGYGDWIELDFPEFNTGTANSYGQGIHNWYSNVAGTDVNTGFYPGFVSPVTVPPGTDFSQPHKYGFLWVPATGSSGPPTNVFGNSSLSGAAAGTPGTLWTGADATSQSGGLAFQVIATGTDGTTGNTFVDLRMHGLGNSTGDCNIYLSGLSGTATQPSTNYTLSLGLAMINGSTAGLTTGIFIASNDLDSGHGFIQGAAFQSISLTGTVQTFTPSMATTPTTAFNTFSIGLGQPSTTQPIDITLRIEFPQVLQASGSPQQGFAKWYFDDTQIGTTAFWNKYDSTQPPPPIQGTTAYSVMDTRHFALNIGLGDTANPLTIYSVSVWQASAANNIVQ